MRQMMNKAASASAAAHAVEASSCACFAMNIALILDAGILASILISLISLSGMISIICQISLLGLMLAAVYAMRLKDTVLTFP